MFRCQNYRCVITSFLIDHINFPWWSCNNTVQFAELIPFSFPIVNWLHVHCSLSYFEDSSFITFYPNFIIQNRALCYLNCGNIRTLCSSIKLAECPLTHPNCVPFNSLFNIVFHPSRSLPKEFHGSTHSSYWLFARFRVIIFTSYHHVLYPLIWYSSCTQETSPSSVVCHIVFSIFI